ncbi:peptide chain release factor N(5)-glutamine methyltransferase [Vampirovibrio chlorellavorus]|uniref:peptide chain release factor N(5)-glutamine methyltransferase n=1 Tax=Vampirovibrio chlorellavorus TaxID=758823 RepID=UPI0026EB3E70|nr:peptide chain release factor N(5)-glutamine methyltransferase [Vampirovibrio chlorellavorus]
MTATFTEAHQEIQTRLLGLGISLPQARAESDWTLETLWNMRPEALYTQGDKRLSESEWAQLQDFLYQRTVKRIPIQYLLHEAWFYGQKFYVNPHVLIPRPETELLVEQALTLLKPGKRVLDVGTGPGTIALSLAHRLDQSVPITAVDVSPEALQVARINQKRLNTQVRLLPAGDLFTPVGTEQFDLIVSNPPYIDRNLQSTLTPEVVDHEPHMALFPPVSEDAYYFYRRLAVEGKAHLQPNGHILMECGAGMGPDITQIFLLHGYTHIQTTRDYAGLDRVIAVSL